MPESISPLGKIIVSKCSAVSPVSHGKDVLYCVQKKVLQLSAKMLTKKYCNTACSA